MSPSYSPLSPVSVGIYTALNVPALTDLAPGGVNSAISAGTTRPYVVFTLTKERELGGFGTWPGHGDMPELRLRISAFTDQPNVSQGQHIIEKAVELLFQPGALTVTGYTVPDQRPLPEVLFPWGGDTDLAGLIVHEEVADFVIIAENIS